MTTEGTRIHNLLLLMEKRLRTLSTYGADHPIQEQADEEIQAAFTDIWSRLPGLPMTVSEEGLEWEAETVLAVDEGSESLAGALFGAGIRFVSFSPGAEQKEIASLLRAISWAQTLTDEDDDDLLAFLWTADLQHIRYKAAETEDVGEEIEFRREAVPQPRTAQEVREQVDEDVRAPVEEPERAGLMPEGVVNLEEYESTLYFLDDRELSYLRAEIEREYDQDLGRSVLSLLFDTFELQTDTEVRSEVIEVLADLLPNLLTSGDFGSVAYLISETRIVLGRDQALFPEHRELLQELTHALSRPEVVAQLLHALDEARVQPSEEDLEELFKQLTPDALVTVLKWIHRLSNDHARRILHMAAGRMAETQPKALGAALESQERVVVLAALRLVQERELRQLQGELEPLLEHPDIGVRIELVAALASVPTSRTMKALVTLLVDADPDVRIAAVKALSAKRYQGALRIIQQAVLGDEMREGDLTERRAFFEAYGTIGGEEAVDNLKTLLLGKGFGLGRADPDTRACAAMALGRVASRSSRELLRKAVKDRDPIVRTASSRALQQVGP